MAKAKLSGFCGKLQRRHGRGVVMMKVCARAKFPLHA